MAAGVIVCYSTCWGCKFGHHNIEPHVWWDDEDVWDEHPEHTKPLPEGQCGCNCAFAIEIEREENEALGFDADGSLSGDVSTEVH